MGISEWMDNWYRKNIEEQDDQKNIHHSASYHSYFEGYTERKIQRPGSSRYRIEREYTGPYFGLKEGEKAWNKSRLWTAVFYALPVVLTLYTVFSGAKANVAGWVAVFGVLELLTLLLLLIPIGGYVTAGYRLEMGVHRRTSGRIRMLSLPGWIFAVLYLLLSLLWYPIRKTVPDLTDISALLSQAASCVAAWALWYLEKNRKYIVVEPGKEKEGYVIQ